MRVGEIRVGMAAAEIRQRFSVDQTIDRRAQTIDKNLARIRPGDGMHGIELDAKSSA